MKMHTPSLVAVIATACSLTAHAAPPCTDGGGKPPAPRSESATRLTWLESMACRLKPLLLQSKLASSMRSLMASTTSAVECRGTTELSGDDD